MSNRELIDDVRARADLIVVLEDAGARIDTSSAAAWDEETPVFCPFCEDISSKKPAGRANQLKGLYFCFSCGWGGDVIKIVRETKGLGFDEALDYLDKKFPKEGERANPWTK